MDASDGLIDDNCDDGPGEALLSTQHSSSFSRGRPNRKVIYDNGQSQMASDWDELVLAYHQKRQEDLLQCGHIQGLRLNSETGHVEEMLASSSKGAKWRPVCAKEEQIEEREREAKLLHRIRSDSSFAVTAAMIGGLASRILMTEDGKEWSNPEVFAIYVTMMAFVVGFNMIYIITCAMVYFNAYRILSVTQNVAKANNARLLGFWRYTEFLRAVSRDVFLLSIPMFMVALSLLCCMKMPFPANRIAGPCLLMFAVISLLISVKSMAYTEVYLCGAVWQAGLAFCRSLCARCSACLCALAGEEDMETVVTPGRPPRQSSITASHSRMSFPDFDNFLNA